MSQLERIQRWSPGARQRIACGALTLAALVLPVPVLAQELRTIAYADSTCPASIPESELVRVVVYASAETTDSASRAALPYADVLVQAMALEAPRLLRAGKDTLPRGEPTVTWRTLRDGLHVTGYRDGSIRWRPEDAEQLNTFAIVIGNAVMPLAGLDTSRAPHRDAVDSAAALLGRMIEAARASGYTFLWPDGLAGDSVEFHLSLRRPTVRRDSTIMHGLRLRAGAPLFSLAVPWEEPAQPREGNPLPKYPNGPRFGNAQGSVLIAMVVGADGAVVPGSAREVWPLGRRRLTGALGRYYADFLESALRVLPSWRFEPARSGGCAVPQLVTVPFTFRLKS